MADWITKPVDPKTHTSNHHSANLAMVVFAIYNLGTWIWWQFRQMCSWLAWEVQLGGGAQQSALKTRGDGCQPARMTVPERDDQRLSEYSATF